MVREILNIKMENFYICISVIMCRQSDKILSRSTYLKSSKILDPYKVEISYEEVWLSQ
jgi:hypothetical protein